MRLVRPSPGLQRRGSESSGGGGAHNMARVGQQQRGPSSSRLSGPGPVRPPEEQRATRPNTAGALPGPQETILLFSEQQPAVSPSRNSLGPKYKP